MKMKILAVVLGLAFWLAVVAMNTTGGIAQEAPVGFQITHHHVGLSVPNAEESAAWYHKMLGFEVVTRMKQGADMTVVHIKRGNCYLELFQLAGAKSLPEHRRDPSADLRVHGTVHIAFQVPDVFSAVRELKGKGAEIAMAPVDTPGVVYAFIRDNAGICFELIQYKNQ